MSWLVDTNVLSELRKGERAEQGIQAWFATTADEDLHTSVLVLGEIRRGIESIRRRDTASAMALDLWLDRLATGFGERILPIDIRVADRWGALDVLDPVPTVDGLLAATALGPRPRVGDSERSRRCVYWRPGARSDVALNGLPLLETKFHLPVTHGRLVPRTPLGVAKRRWTHCPRAGSSSAVGGPAPLTPAGPRAK